MATTKGSSAGKSNAAAKAPAVTKGHCQCGTIEYEFTGEPKWVMHCHCESCRRAVSSAVATYVGVRLEQFSYLKGEPTVLRVLARREALLLHQLRLADGLCRDALAGRGASLPRHARRSRAVAADRTCARDRAGGVVRDQRSPAALRGDGGQGRQARAQGAEEAERRVLRGPAPRTYRLAKCRSCSGEEIDDAPHCCSVSRCASLPAPPCSLITAGAATTPPSRSPWPGRSRRLKYENPHATITVKAAGQGVDGDAGAGLAHAEPRRAAELVAVGKTVSAYGYASTRGEGRDARRAHHRRRQDGRDALMPAVLAEAPQLLIALEQSGLGSRDPAVDLGLSGGQRRPHPGADAVCRRRRRHGCAAARRVRGGAAGERGAAGAARGDAGPAADAGHRLRAVRRRGQPRGHEPGVPDQGGC